MSTFATVRTPCPLSGCDTAVFLCQSRTWNLPELLRRKTYQYLHRTIDFAYQAHRLQIRFCDPYHKIGVLTVLSCGAACSKRHINKSCAISVAIATYQYVTQAGNGHLSPIEVVPDRYVFKLCVYPKTTVILESPKHSRRSTSKYFCNGF